MRSWHKKHISTKWGVIVLGLLLVSGILLVTTLQNTQVLTSHAYTETGTGNSEPCSVKTKFFTLPCLKKKMPDNPYNKKLCGIKGTGTSCVRKYATCGGGKKETSQYSCNSGYKCCK